MKPGTPARSKRAPEGNIFIVSAPSGTGKHSVLERVLQREPNVVYSISSTTRPPRAGEQDGKDYYFLSAREFRRRVAAGRFAEWAEVHGHLYGTLRDELLGKIKTGKDVILQLDVQGMRNLKAAFPQAVSIFLMPPSLEELERRLRNRGMNTEEDLRLRLKNAETEVAQCHAYDFIIVNDDLEKAVEDVLAVIRSRRESKAAGTARSQVKKGPKSAKPTKEKRGK